MDTVYNWVIIHDLFINQIENDIFTLSLTIAGISISVFTLLLSFISNKRQNAIELKTSINNGLSDPVLKSRLSHYLNYMKRMGKMVKSCVIVFITACVLTITAWLSFRFVHTPKVMLYFLVGNIVLFITIVIYSFVVLYKVYRQFLKEIKI